MLASCLIISCSKSSSDNNSSTNNGISGNYRGDINVFINGYSHSTNNGKVITFTASSSDKVIITNNVMQSTIGTLSGNTLTITKAIVNSTSTFNTVEYGSATFNGNNVTIDFHQEMVNPSNGSIIGSGDWKGTLTKQ